MSVGLVISGMLIFVGVVLAIIGAEDIALIAFAATFLVLFFDIINYEVGWI